MRDSGVATAKCTKSHNHSLDTRGNVTTTASTGEQSFTTMASTLGGTRVLLANSRQGRVHCLVKFFTHTGVVCLPSEGKPLRTLTLQPWHYFGPAGVCRPLSPCLQQASRAAARAFLRLGLKRKLSLECLLQYLFVHLDASGH